MSTATNWRRAILAALQAQPWLFPLGGVSIDSVKPSTATTLGVLDLGNGLCLRYGGPEGLPKIKIEFW
jgi:hypothetical protein